MVSALPSTILGWLLGEVLSLVLTRSGFPQAEERRRGGEAIGVGQ